MLWPDWGIDGRHNLAVGARYVDSQPIYDGVFFYPPAAAVAFAPWSVLDTEAALATLAALKISLIGALVWLEVRGSPPLDRLLLAGAVVLSLGPLHDIILGNTNVWIAAAAFIALRRNSPVAGVPLGIVLATFPKPLVAPLLIFIVFRRRDSLVGAVLAGTVTTILAMVLAGPAAYADWARALADAGRFAGWSGWNLGVSSVDPTLAVLVGVAAMLIVTYMTARRSEPRAIAAACAAGPLVSPYAGLYSAAVLPIATRALAMTSAGTTIVLAIAAPVAVPIALSAFCMIIIGASLVRAEPGKRLTQASDAASDPKGDDPGP